MDCREIRALLTAFHDGELPDADRVRVQDHLHGCPGCGARLADLARVDAAAGVPDPGPAYWERFNARVADRIEREAEGPKAAVLRAKRGWIRQQLRYLVPAVAAAAMVVMVVRYGGLHPGAPTPAAPPVVGEPAGQAPAKAERESPAAKAREGAAAARRVPAESGRVAESPAVGYGRPGAGTDGDARSSSPPAYTPPATAEGRIASATREEGTRMADRVLTEENEKASPDRAAAPAGYDTPSPPPLTTYRAGSPPGAAKEGMPSFAQAERKKMAASETAKDVSSASPCERARALAARERWKEAEAAQRECLAQERSAPAQEKGLVYLAELLDRQARFAEADAVITEVHRQFPQSIPLATYRRQRPMVQRQQAPSPATR